MLEFKKKYEKLNSITVIILEMFWRLSELQALYEASLAASTAQVANQPWDIRTSALNFRIGTVPSKNRRIYFRRGV